MKFQKKDIEILEGILKKFSYQRKHGRKKIVLMDYRIFLSLLNTAERKLIKKIQNLDISKYGKKTPFYGIKAAPKNLVMVKGQKLPVSFLPKKVYQAFKKMNRAIKKDVKKPLFINSGYRSPAYQMLVFISGLKNKNWKIKETIKGIALPGYSEHGNPGKQAIDFKTLEIPGKRKKDFSKTKEYRWLLKNAAKFGFYLSFPKNNKFRVKFEPWHWHYESPEKQFSPKSH